MPVFGSVKCFYYHFILKSYKQYGKSISLSLKLVSRSPEYAPDDRRLDRSKEEPPETTIGRSLERSQTHLGDN